MVRKVAIYTRVSTLDQTIDNQLIELRDHCSRMGWEVVKEYADEGLDDRTDASGCWGDPFLWGIEFPPYPVRIFTGTSIQTPHPPHFLL